MKKWILLTVLIGSIGIVGASKKTSGSKFEYLDLFSKVLDLIENQYYRKVDTEKLIEGAIRGMLDTLDPHSVYLNASALRKMKDETSGKFGGLGLEVTQKDGQFIVITPIDDTPAFRSGIKSGDRIVEIDHQPIIGFSLEEAVEKMRGKSGTKINVGILRKGEDKIRYFSLKREIIQVKPVRSALIHNHYIYIRLTQFQADSAKFLIKHIKKLSKKNEIKGIVFDLRSNPGGLLDEAVNVSSIFLEDGIVVSTEGRDPKNKEVRFVKKSGYKNIKTPLAVLINGASASASEIVAGAIQDHKRGLIVGSQSFGKGSVQTILDLSKNHGIKLTIQQYMTPEGRKIQAKGISPDVEIPMVKGDWREKYNSEQFFVREVDLRNHLNATIESSEEKKQRLAREKKNRLDRRAKQKKKSEEKEDDLPKKVEPQDDFQVIQAINYLKTYNVFENIKN